MIIPPYTATQDRDGFVKFIADVCLGSRQERKQLYDRRKRYFLFGAFQDVARYNRLKAHMDLVASFLYAADHAKFEVSPPINSHTNVVKKFSALRTEWNDDFRDSGLAYRYADLLVWSLVFDTMLIKMGWNQASNSPLYGEAVMPWNFGVYREDKMELDDQEAFCHVYRLDYDNAVQRLARAGKAKDIPKLTSAKVDDDMLLPPILQNLLIAQTGGANLSGNIIGQANVDFEPTGTYEPKIEAPTVEMKEVWVWDDEKSDYAIFEMIDNDMVVGDSRAVVSAMSRAASVSEKNEKPTSDNTYLPDEHPFVPITPYKMLDFFWGEAGIDKLIPLQKWTNERLDQIHDILDRQADPAKVFSGFMGLTDEKAGALGGAGTWVLDQMPNATVKELAPEMPPDLFAEVTAIGQIFLEASGLTETTAGHGEAGVRSKGHAKQLATMGSARIRKVAVAQEEPLNKVAHLGLKLKMRNDAEKITGDDGKEFVAAQLASFPWKVRIAGHSHSPLFGDDAKEFAVLAMKARAIDEEMFVRLWDPPEADTIIANLRERQQKAQAAARAQKLTQTPPSGPGGAKGKRGSNGSQRPTAP